MTAYWVKYHYTKEVLTHIKALNICPQARIEPDNIYLTILSCEMPKILKFTINITMTYNTLAVSRWKY
jgi:hypothetical protein